MQKPIKIIFIVLGVLMTLSILLSASCGGCKSDKGDGVTTCKGCGGTPVVALGFCERCYEGFIRYTYGEVQNVKHDHTECVFAPAD
jgi:hypothetical protein